MQARFDRQGVLNDEVRRFYFLLTKQALRLKSAADTVMMNRLRHDRRSRRPDIVLAILPNDTYIQSSPLNVFVVHDDRLVICG